MDLSKINWAWKIRDFMKVFPNAKESNNTLALIIKLDDIDCKGILHFASSGVLLNIGLVIPFDLFDKAVPGSELSDFFNTYYIIKNIFGEPTEFSGEGINKLADLESMESINELNLKYLPKAIWDTENGKIIHRFIDHWGIVPETTMLRPK